MGISYQMLLYFFWLILAVTTTGQDECSEIKCGRGGPAVRFPFKIKGKHPSHCGYPGFDLSCNENQQPVLELPGSVKFIVQKINYESKVIDVSDPDNCPQRSIRNLDISASPFNYYTLSVYNVTFFYCSGSSSPTGYDRVTCLESTPGDPVYSVPSDSYIYDSSDTILNCEKMYDIFSVPREIVYDRSDVLQLNWTRPDCWTCEFEDKKCRLNTTSTKNEIECYGKLREKTDVGKILLIAGSVLGTIVIVILFLAFYSTYRAKRIQEENQARVEMFLEDYKAFKPARYTYNDIKTITDDFKDKLGQGGYGTVYKGKLSNEVTVAVKILVNSKGDGVEFINEVGTMGRIHHVNVVRLVGYCADGYRRALVYEFLPNDSLEKFIFSENGNKDQSLSWEKLHGIALGIGKGIEYLHQGCEQRIVHFDIKPHNILLDQNFNPKICDFGLAKLCSKDQSVVSMTAARGTMGYIAPEVFSRNFGNASHKSDVYSFGMLLLEMVGGRKNVDATVEKTSQVFFPEWVYTKLSQGEEPVIRIDEDVDPTTAKKLMIVGLWCIQWNPADRPSMRVVVQMLEGEDENLTLPPNPFAANKGARMNVGMPGMPFHEHHLTVISEAEESI
ncbi:glycerophosphodiester phosphodiesterase protein kinase domain-containing GDPDL2-like [Tripterygium wilfordii]|uniref:Glycerophosphodiester phosphodiesterase protein kinase domain-containing GDPDL2-like n=1 Tax=Tripterygium wilfordii TaxID=458696 RepID=A0A7J7C5K8_TRIWF|nr:rust resistance kinase Lr10-like [Tripterygium wilfordii]KAF5729235.1 glycerophosphodiester phosphodiesterase protein kinase domain-containing GDPDL2-like [Tripterygium wilfordii]